MIEAMSATHSKKGGILDHSRDKMLSPDLMNRSLDSNKPRPQLEREMAEDEWRQHKQFHPCLAICFLILGCFIVPVIIYFNKVMF